MDSKEWRRAWTNTVLESWHVSMFELKELCTQTVSFQTASTVELSSIWIIKETIEKKLIKETLFDLICDEAPESRN